MSGSAQMAPTYQERRGTYGWNWHNTESTVDSLLYQAARLWIAAGLPVTDRDPWSDQNPFYGAVQQAWEDAYTELVLPPPLPDPPSGPAVYRLKNHSGELLYIGVSSNAGVRARAHKRKPWGPEIATADYEPFDTMEAARDAERRAIARERPRYNIIGRVPWLES